MSSNKGKQLNILTDIHIIIKILILQNYEVF